MVRTLGVVLLATLALILGACSSAAGPAATPAPAVTTAPASTAAPAPAAATAPKPAAATTAPAAPLAATAEKLLTVADVEKATGLSGVKVVPYNPGIGAGGDVNFANKDGELILMLKMSGSSAFNTMKNDAKYSSGPIGGIGDGAFGIPSPLNPKESFGVAFLKGPQAATLNTYLGLGGLAISFDKVQELARLVASRM